MSLSPFWPGFWDDPWEGSLSPSRLFGQNFGNVLTPDDFMPPRQWRGMIVTPRVQRPPQTTGMSEVVNDDKQFKICLGVEHFKPEEINIKTVGNRVVIKGKHEEKQDEHGYIMREFTRQYILPKDVEPNTVTSSLTPDGVLVLKAPKKALEEPQERIIPITHEPSSAEAVQQ